MSKIGEIKSMNKLKHENVMNQLFKEWKKVAHHKGNIFVEDGIIDYDKWTKSKKILFLLKEAYSEEGSVGDWKLSYLINCNEDNWVENNKHYFMLSMWSFVLSSPETPLPDYLHEIFSQGYEYLLSSAVINIKKSNGASTSSDSDIRKYAQLDKEFLKKQIEIISPEIILCGNTCIDLMNSIFEYPKTSDYGDLYASEYCFKYKDMTIIDYWHPSRKPDVFKYTNDLRNDYLKYSASIKFTA